MKRCIMFGEDQGQGSFHVAGAYPQSLSTGLKTTRTSDGIQTVLTFTFCALNVMWDTEGHVIDETDW